MVWRLFLVKRTGGYFIDERKSLSGNFALKFTLTILALPLIDFQLVLPYKNGKDNRLVIILTRLEIPIRLGRAGNRQFAVVLSKFEGVPSVIVLCGKPVIFVVRRS